MEQNALKSQLDELLITLKQYLEGSLLHIKLMADGFYKTVEQQSWQQLSEFSEALTWIFQVYESVEAAQQKSLNYVSWDAVKKSILKLSSQIEELERAIASQDLILIADLLNYEVIPIMEELHEHVSDIINNEADRNDIN